jgi:hypothetical protein
VNKQLSVSIIKNTINRMYTNPIEQSRKHKEFANVVLSQMLPDNTIVKGGVSMEFAHLTC